MCGGGPRQSPAGLVGLQRSGLRADGHVSWECSALSVETELVLFLHLHAERRPPFIKAKSWPRLVTHWGCSCHLGHTLCQLKLFFISWMTDSSLIVLLFFSLYVRKHGLERGNAWPLLICLDRKMVLQNMCDRVSNVVIEREVIAQGSGSSSWDVVLVKHVT